MNATFHGLTGTFNVVGSEQPGDYADALNQWLEAFAPTNGAQRRLAVIAGDIMWRLERLTRIEQRHVHAQVEANLKKTPEYGTKSRIGVAERAA